MDLAAHARGLADAARAASLRLMPTPGDTRNNALLRAADHIDARVRAVLEANALDMAAGVDLPPATRSRLHLDARKVADIARAVRDIAAQPDPVGRILHGEVRPNGLRLEKRSVPLGVVLFIYESRPNVTSDAAALCLKSGNAVILRSGREATHSADALFGCFRDALADTGLPEAAVQLVDVPDRELVTHLLACGDAIDVAIPRGGKGLVRAVTEAATMPVLKHLDGNCHLYVHADVATATGAAEEALAVIVNAKAGYAGGGVCNAVEHVLFHREAASLMPRVCDALAAAGVEVRGDDSVRAAWPAAVAATDADWDEEYLALIVSLKVVDDLEAAVSHINRHGSRHTDGILTRDVRAADAFVAGVDSASVMINASTRFADGGQYGLGAEIGISTDKLHARGPMGAADLCSYKWVVTGHGQIR